MDKLRQRLLKECETEEEKKKALEALEGLGKGKQEFKRQFHQRMSMPLEPDVAREWNKLTASLNADELKEVVESKAASE